MSIQRKFRRIPTGVTLPEPLMKALDTLAKDFGTNRTGIIEDSLMQNPIVKEAFNKQVEAWTE